MPTHTPGGWTKYYISMPGRIAKNMRKQLIEDDITFQQLLFSFAHAYGAGLIKVEHNPVCPGRIKTSFKKLADPDDYRILLKTQGGEVINPLPMTQKDIYDL